MLSDLKTWSTPDQLVALLLRSRKMERKTIRLYWRFHKEAATIVEFNTGQIFAVLLASSATNVDVLAILDESVDPESHLGLVHP